MMRLEAINLSVRRKDCVLVQAASLAATSGEFIGLVGPNGAGKTTLLRALAGLEAPAAGHVAIGGADIRAMTPRERARKLAFLPQAREVAWSITAEAVVALGRFAYGTPARLGPEDRAAVDRALASTDAGAFRTRTMPTLSGGEQARIHLARALAAETPILLADEPTAALDPKHARAIMQALRAKADEGGLVFAALHDLRLAGRWCSRIIVMNEGELVADDDAERAMTPAIMEAVFGAGLADH